MRPNLQCTFFKFIFLLFYIPHWPCI